MSEEAVPEVDPAALALLVVTQSLEGYAASQADDLRILRFIDADHHTLDDVRHQATHEFLQLHPEVDPATAEVLVDGVIGIRDGVDGDGGFDNYSEIVRGTIEMVNESGVQFDLASLQDLLRLSGTRPSSQRMRTSVLVNLVAAFEVHVAEMMRVMARYEPRPLVNDKTTVRWDQVASADSIEALREDVIESVIDGALRGDLPGWLAFFETRYQTRKIEISAVVHEGYLRRHTVVHGGGRATREYIKRCGDLGIACPPLGTYLDVSSDYLQQLADALFSLAFELGVNLASRLGMTAGAESAFVNLTYRMLISRRFEAVRLVCGRYVRSSFIASSSANIVKANYFVAMRRLGRSSECSSMVEEWDVSALERQYKVAKLIIQGQIPLAHSEIQLMLKSGELERRFWLAWPLFEEVREYDRQLRGANQVSPGVEEEKPQAV